MSKHNFLNLTEKYILNITIEVLSKKIGCGESKISEILKKQKDQIVKQFSNGQFRHSAKLFITGNFKDVETNLLNLCTTTFE